MNGLERVAREAEARFAAAGVRLTLGGEPTLVPFQPEGPEWSVSADGPTKLPIARRLARDLQLQVWPGSTLLYCPGKCYEGEVNPRWTLRLITGPGGAPPVRWPTPCQPGLEGRNPTPAEARAWLDRLGEVLGTELHPLALRDPLHSGRSVWAVPLTTDGDPPPAGGGSLPWRAIDWELEPGLCQLTGAPGPAGLRLPLQHFPGDVPRQVLTVEVGDESWGVFLPPLNRESLEQLLQAIADSLAGLRTPSLSGVLPLDCDGHWQVLGLTSDPGVLEINLPVCHSWEEYRGWLEQLDLAAARVGLRSWKQVGGNRQAGTGGGNHLLWGGPDLERHPFFGRPAWLAGILRFWQHHPTLAYLFSGPCVGPASQAPRPDEAAGELFDLELAYRVLEKADGQSPAGAFGDHRELIGETLRHLHADRSGNNHRSEISFDKFWNPGSPAGCLGLIEFRALESLPRQEWTTAIALLWSALAAHLLEPSHRPRSLKDWGAALHDRMLLPSQLWADLETILALLEADGMGLPPEPFRQLWEWRFPLLLHWQDGPHRLEVRPALEPWPLICDFPREGGFTSRFIDASLHRFELIASDSFRRQCRIRINGHLLSFPPGGVEGAPPLLAVRYRHHRLYPCLHPAIEPHLPLTLVIEAPDGCHAFTLDPEDGDIFREGGDVQEEGKTPDRNGLPVGGSDGRRRPGDVTVDLRLLR